MAAKSKLLENIDERDKLAVHGWMRNVKQNVKLAQNIPSLVSSICILYFQDDEIFDKKGIKVNISTDNKEILGPSGMFAVAYSVKGINKISSLRPGKYEWDIKITDVEKPRKWPIYIGVACDIDNKHFGGYYLSNGTFDTYQIDSEKNTSYPMYSMCNFSTRYVEESVYEKDDKISVCLDLLQDKITFKKNDIDQQFKFKGLQKGENITYRLSVHIRAGAYLEIVKFRRL